MRDNHALDIDLCQMVLDTTGQCCPDGKRHVFAVDLRDLLAQQITLGRQGWNGSHQLVNTELGGCVVNVVGGG